MKLVLDTNVLLSFFWKGSLIKKLLGVEHELYSPKFALEELIKHKPEILDKTHLTNEEFNEFLFKLQRVVNFIPLSKYSDSLKRALSLIPEHEKDADFLALALEIGASILSKDKKLKRQSVINIFDESDIPKLL